MKVYVTHYALTDRGIYPIEAELLPHGNGVMPHNNHFPSCLYQGEWAPDRESALKQAEEMVRKRILSLRKQIERLKELKIEVHE